MSAMALRQVGKLTSVLSQSALPRLLVARAISANAGPRERIWNCSKGQEGEVKLNCLKDMLADGDIQLFDVREPHERASTGRIPKSTNIPRKFFIIFTAFYLPFVFSFRKTLADPGRFKNYVFIFQKQ